MLASALWAWLQQWKQNNWHSRAKPIWAATLWQNIAASCGESGLQVHHLDAHVPKSQATEKHKNNQLLPRLKWFRGIWVRTLSPNYFYLSWPMMPQDIKEEILYIGGLMTEEWT